MMELRNDKLSQQDDRAERRLHTFSLMRPIATITRPGGRLTVVCLPQRNADSLPPSREEAYHHFLAERPETTP